MNVLEVAYWVDALSVPVLVVGAVMFGAGVWGIVRSRRERVTE